MPEQQSHPEIPKQYHEPLAPYPTVLVQNICWEIAHLDSSQESPRLQEQLEHLRHNTGEHDHPAVMILEKAVEDMEGRDPLSDDFDRHMFIAELYIKLSLHPQAAAKLEWIASHIDSNDKRVVRAQELVEELLHKSEQRAEKLSLLARDALLQRINGPRQPE